MSRSRIVVMNAEIPIDPKWLAQSEFMAEQEQDGTWELFKDRNNALAGGLAEEEIFDLVSDNIPLKEAEYGDEVDGT